MVAYCAWIKIIPKVTIILALAQQSVDVWANSWMSTTGGELSNTALSMLVNDNATEYQPRGYERSFLSTYHALNHLDLNNWENARVEIKRCTRLNKLRRIIIKRYIIRKLKNSKR